MEELGKDVGDLVERAKKIKAVYGEHFVVCGLCGLTIARNSRLGSEQVGVCRRAQVGVVFSDVIGCMLTRGEEASG